MPRERRLARSYVFYAGGLAVYALVRVGFAGFHATAFSDTAGYERTAHAALWSARFWAGERAFVVPLVYKMLPGGTARIVFQLAFSIVCWSLLSLAAARCMRTEWGRRAAFAVVLLFGATRYVIGWDSLLLSESISLSLFALLVAAALTAARRPSPRTAGAALVAAAAWSFVRDSNAVVVALAGVVVLALAVRPAHRSLKLAVGLAALAIFVGSAVSADAGRRWQAPFGDVVTYRLRDRPGLETRHAYLRYLVLHPRYALVEPFSGSQHAPYTSTGKAASLLNPQLDRYVATLNGAARMPRDVVDVLWVHSLAGALALAALAAAAAAATVRRRRAAWAALGILLSAYPAALAAWHLSGIEIDRHALGAAVALRLGAYLLLALALDGTLARVTETPRPSAASPAAQSTNSSGRLA